MRGESRIALFVVAISVAPSLIKKSKPFARYVGDQLIRAGEYLKHGMEEEKPTAPSDQIPEAELVAEAVGEDIPHVPTEPEVEPEIGTDPVAEAETAAVEPNKPKKSKSEGK